MVNFATALVGVVYLTLHWSGPTNAADGLYPDPPPKDAAFVRWLDADAENEFSDLDFSELVRNAYHPISSHLIPDVEVGGFYSAALDASGVVALIEEPARADQGKVHLILLNLTAAPLSLHLAARNVNVIASTPTNSAQLRAVNPISVALELQSTSGAVLEEVDLRLRRGQDVTIVARPDGVELVESQFGPNVGR